MRSGPEADGQHETSRTADPDGGRLGYPRERAPPARLRTVRADAPPVHDERDFKPIAIVEASSAPPFPRSRPRIRRPHPWRRSRAGAPALADVGWLQVAVPARARPTPSQRGLGCFGPKVNAHLREDGLSEIDQLPCRWIAGGDVAAMRASSARRCCATLRGERDRLHAQPSRRAASRPAGLDALDYPRRRADRRRRIDGTGDRRPGPRRVRPRQVPARRQHGMPSRSIAVLPRRPGTSPPTPTTTASWIATGCRSSCLR